MPNVKRAERILRLVTSTDRACSITGDLLENDAGRGSWWFWLSILRITVSQIWRDLADAPWQMFRLAIRGLFEWWVGAQLSWIVILVWNWVWPYKISLSETYIAPWGFFSLMAALRTALPFLVGWRIANRSKGRHLAAGLALALPFAGFGALNVIGRRTIAYYVGKPFPYMENILISSGAVLFSILAGALFSRLRASEPDRASIPPRKTA